MKKVMPIVIVLLVFLVSCDRFEHEPFVDASLEGDIQRFFDDLSTASEDSLSGIMSWYSEEYLNDKMNKADIEHEYAIYFNEYGDELELTGELEGYWSNRRIEWILTGVLPDTTIIIAEKTDFLKKEAGVYRFYGNQISPPELDESKPVVLVQYFTSTTCGNCPDASRKLEEMEAEYGEQLVVIEYVANSDPGSVYSENSQYYSAVQPTSVFQGEYRVDGAGESSLAEYEIHYQQIVERELEFRFTNIELTAEPNSVNVVVNWEAFAELSGENLVIKAVILEEDPGFSYIFDNSVYFSNRIIAGAEMAFVGEDIQAEFSIQSSIELPDDCSVVVWLQNLPEVWDTATVYNVIKKELGE